MSLKIEKFTSSEIGAWSNSYLVSGQKEAILFDVFMLRDDAAALADKIKASGKTLAQVFISHAHPDHFMGTEVIVEHFPNAEVISTPATIADIQEDGPWMLGFLQKKLGPKAPQRIVVPKQVAGKSLSLEGVMLEIVEFGEGEASEEEGIEMARILFSEGSSLTAREFLSVLGPTGHHIEIADPNPACICRFSRWAKRVHRCPPAGSDPLGYLHTINSLLATGAFDVLLPTHEQAWLFAAGRALLSPEARIAIASVEAFSRVQSKIEFARLLDEVDLPQPKWRLVEAPEELADWPTPFYLKAPFSTAGVGVRRVMKASDANKAFESIVRVVGATPLMVQSAADGEYAQVQAMFDRGRLIAVHTSTQTAVGIGPSAAGRVGVDHPFARNEVAILGERLGWHGGLTLDYLFRGEEPVYIECNPRTVEPANAAASGVNLPELQLAISLGEKVQGLRIGRPGVRTHSSLAILLCTAAYVGKRKAVFRELLRLITHRGPYKDSRESLTPVFYDLPSLIPLAIVAACVLLLPASAKRLASAAVKTYSITPQAIERLRLSASSGDRRSL